MRDALLIYLFTCVHLTKPPNIIESHKVYCGKLEISLSLP